MSDGYATVKRYLSSERGATGNHSVRDENGVAWILKPALRPDKYSPGKHSYRWLLSEFAAIRIMRELGLTLPTHAPIRVTEAFLKATPQLGKFAAGLHLGVEMVENAYALDQVKPDKQVKTRVITALDNHDEAPGVVIGDTWLANHDRSHGSQSKSENGGNLLFQQDGSGSNETWTMWLIDFGHCFNHVKWGEAATGDWPDHVRGTVTLFFDADWLPSTYAGNEDAFEYWIDRVEGIDVDNLLEEVRAEMPEEWTNSGDLSPTSADWNDLAERLRKHLAQLRQLLMDKYSEAYLLRFPQKATQP